MKAVFGLLVLVVVLAIVASLAKKNLVGSAGLGSVAAQQDGAAREAARQSTGSATSAGGGRPDPLSGAAAADPGATLARGSGDLQQRAVDRTTDALRQGQQRNERALP